jgi:hypothetical protein
LDLLLACIVKSLEILQGAAILPPIVKLFLDDERPVPNDSWHHVRTAEAAIDFLEAHGAFLAHVSLDHDLGQHLTGYDVVCALEAMLHDGKINPDVIVTIHSANPAGARKMAQACEAMFGQRWTTYIVDYIALCRYENEAS